MGGKNAIIVDADTDLDEAIPAISHCTFGYQGEKCSACSRVIVVDSIDTEWVERLLAAAQSLRMGPAEDPSYAPGATIDADERFPTSYRLGQLHHLRPFSPSIQSQPQTPRPSQE